MSRDFTRVPRTRIKSRSSSAALVACRAAFTDSGPEDRRVSAKAGSNRTAAPQHVRQPAGSRLPHHRRLRLPGQTSGPASAGEGGQRDGDSCL